MKGSNLIARQVSRLRYERGWTQDELADLLHKAGWFISRSGVSKIEGGLVYVHDFRLVWLASVFQVKIGDLLPRIDGRVPVLETLGKYIDPKKLNPPPGLLLPLRVDSAECVPEKPFR